MEAPEDPVADLADPAAEAEALAVVVEADSAVVVEVSVAEAFVDSADRIRTRGMGPLPTTDRTAHWMRSHSP